MVSPLVHTPIHTCSTPTRRESLEEVPHRSRIVVLPEAVEDESVAHLRVRVESMSMSWSKENLWLGICMRSWGLAGVWGNN